MDSVARLLWRPLREGEGNGPAPPWRAAEHASIENAADELDWIAREGRWLARVDATGPRGGWWSFVVRDGIVVELPPPLWWDGVSDQTPGRPLFPQVRAGTVSRGAMLRDWVAEWEGERRTRDMAYVAPFYLDPKTSVRMAHAVSRTREGDIMPGKWRRAVAYHMTVVEAFLAGKRLKPKRIDRALEDLGDMASAAQWREFKLTETPAERRASLLMEHAIRAARDVVLMVGQWDLHSVGAIESTAHAHLFAMRARDCVCSIQSPRFTADPPVDESVFTRETEAAVRRAILDAVGDRIYLTLADEALNGLDSADVPSP